jgi:hypothetical protein
MQIRRTASRAHFLLAAALLVFLLAGCSALRPRVTLPTGEQAPIYIPPTLAAASLVTPTADLTAAASAQGENCTNELTFLGDISIPDGTSVEPGTTLDKQWDIKNSGTCDWDETYSIRLLDGPDLGATTPQAITPLRTDVEGVIRIVFTAPQEPGNYISKWQAYGPDGEPFGQFFSIEINVIEN